MRNNHKTIFLYILENFKELTFFELSILTEFFKKRLIDFDSKSEELASHDLKNIDDNFNLKYQLPAPESITLKNNNVPILQLTDFAKVNFSFIYDFCNLVISDVTLRTIQKQLKINYKTAVFWRHKVFTAIRDYMKFLILKRTIYFDEIYVKIGSLDINKRSNFKKNETTPLTGKAIVAVACDDFGTVICNDFGETLDTVEKYYQFYKSHVEKDSTVIGDSHAGLSKLINELNLSDNRVKFNKTDPMIMHELQPINSLSSSIKRFVKQKHHGITKENLQDYLNLASLKQTLIKHRYYHNQMVLFLVELIYSSSASLKFRDLFPRKNS